MMLWDIIRDFFVEHIFGGVTSTGNIFAPTIMSGKTTLDPVFNIGGLSISLADWLSTTATIIMLVLLLIMLLSLVRFVIRQVSGLFSRI